MHLLFRVATSRSCRCVRPSVPVLDFKLAVHEAGRSRGAVKFKELLCRWLQSPNPPLDDKTSVRTMQLTIGLLLRCAPALLKAAVLHLLSLSQTSRVWDLRTTLFLTLVKAARFGSPGRLIDAQQSSIRADGNGISSSSLHVVEDHFPLPKDNNVKEVVYQAIEDLSSGGETFADVEVNPVGGEWVGHRNIATSKAEEASSASQSVVSRCPNDEYSALVRDTQNGITILYFHGGQFWYVPHANLILQ